MNTIHLKPKYTESKVMFTDDRLCHRQVLLFIWFGHHWRGLDCIKILLCIKPEIKLNVERKKKHTHTSKRLFCVAF